MGDTIRILDLNIWNYNDPWEARRDAIVVLILDSQPDIVALQEVRHQSWRDDPRHQADQIVASLPGYHLLWHPAHYWPAEPGSDQGRQWEGLALLSPHPFTDLAVAHLSRDMNDPRDHFQRLVLAGEIHTHLGPFWLFNTHFPLSGAARERVAVESVQFVAQIAGELPFAFTGDLNAEPQDWPIRFMTGQVEAGNQRSPLTDAWVGRHGAEPGYTYSAWEPSQRIDYLLVPPVVQVKRMEVVGMVPGREHVSPSDHCGLLADLQLTSG